MEGQMKEAKRKEDKEGKTAFLEPSGSIQSVFNGADFAADVRCREDRHSWLLSLKAKGGSKVAGSRDDVYKRRSTSGSSARQTP
eukprot:3221392-Rhodomonas_salina.3